MRVVVYIRIGIINFYENCEIFVGLRVDLFFLVFESLMKNIFEYNDNMNVREEFFEYYWILVSELMFVYVCVRFYGGSFCLEEFCLLKFIE